MTKPTAPKYAFSVFFSLFSRSLMELAMSSKPSCYPQSVCKQNLQYHHYQDILWTAWHKSRVVIKAIIPANKKAKGVPPFASDTANPKTANIPPPTMPPIPIEMAPVKLSFSFIL